MTSSEIYSIFLTDSPLSQGGYHVLFWLFIYLFFYFAFRHFGKTQFIKNHSDKSKKISVVIIAIWPVLLMCLSYLLKSFIPREESVYFEHIYLRHCESPASKLPRCRVMKSDIISRNTVAVFFYFT